MEGEHKQGNRTKKTGRLASSKKSVLVVPAALIVILSVCMVFIRQNTDSAKTDAENEMTVVQNPVVQDEPEETVQQTESVKLNVSVNITELYHTHAGDAGNLYFIDENNVLWGSGGNEHGQLGLETPDYDFHKEAVKIAENVIDVDYSQKGFIIFLTQDNKLYGLRNAGCGALQQYQTFDGSKYVNDEHYCITEPYLLMEDVKYARCGRADVACLALDGTVWIWGYNISGNCGVEAPELISEPIKVAEDVNMVWTDRALPNYPEPETEDIVKALRGELTYNTEYEDIAEFDGIYPKFLNNTVIRKSDGSYQACGENVGTEEKIVHGAEADYPVICTYEFLPCYGNGSEKRKD